MRRLGVEGAVEVGVEAVEGGVVDVVAGEDEVVEGVVAVVGGGFRFCFWIDGMLCVCGGALSLFLFRNFYFWPYGGDKRGMCSFSKGMI